MGFQLWMAWRYLFSGKAFRGEILALSLLGLALGVAALVVAMAVVSGYQSTLRRAVIDVTGHVLVGERGPIPNQGLELAQRMEPLLVDSLVAQTPFIHLEAIVAHQGQVSGVFVEGLDLKSFEQVLNLEPRLVEGRFLKDSQEEVAEAMIGQGLAKRLELQAGDEIRLVIPVSSGLEGSGFRSRMARFKVVGVLDLGRHDYNLRYVAMEIGQAQDFAQVGDHITGFRLRLKSANLARPVSLAISHQPDGGLWAKDWQEINRSLFEAAALEKVVIFVVLSLMIVAASFTVASTLLISVVRRYRDISLLKAMGATAVDIRRMFTYQGLLIGLLGSLLGLILGLVACWAFMWAVEFFDLFPAEVYKLDSIQLDLRPLDLLATVAACILVCFLATLAPARKGAKLSPVEGLRYE